MKIDDRWPPASVVFAVLLLAAGCGQTPPAPAAAPTAGGQSSTAATASERYSPGLGEIMTLQQMRHTKLWLAGQAGNWELAAYEIKELGEGFDDVVKFHPTHEDSPVAPKDAIPRMVTGPLADVGMAVDSKDARRFEQTYDALTKSCNDCHKATNFGFNVVQRPAANPYPNQSFAPAAK